MATDPHFRPCSLYDPPSLTLLTTNLKWTCLGLNPDLSIGKLAINHLRQPFLGTLVSLTSAY
jgi:hypothetical protein